MRLCASLFIRLLACALPLSLPTQPALAQRTSAARGDAGDAGALASYERRATLSKELGATQMNVTEDLPLAMWEVDGDDPYPAWFVHHATLFKIFPPTQVQPFVDMPYARRVQAIVAKRCAILARLGLTGTWVANEPAVLPEPFFAAHPELRGPRIDHPARSKKTHYAPNVDRPEMLTLYRESVRTALSICPQIETFNWVTTDAGSGFDWTPGLYSGTNGNSDFRDRPIADRVAGFMINIQQAAKEKGHEVRVLINQIEPRQWMVPTFGPDVLENTIRKLPRGLGVNGIEGPDGRRFETSPRGGRGPFYPLVGLVVPSLAPVPPPSPSGRAWVNLGDDESVDFNYRLLKATRGMPMGSLLQRLGALRAFAVVEVGEARADDLVELWSALNDVRQRLDILDFGGMLRFGHVLNRWITRPMVPYPLELTDAEKSDYRRFLFQAKGEEQASNLVDIQAMREYEGWGAKMLFQRTIETAVPRANHALTLALAIRDSTSGDAARRQWDLTAKRIQALIYLMQSADNMVAYQAQLDRVRSIGAKPEENPVLGVQSAWDRSDLMETARKEIDTMVNLKRLLESTDAPILDLAPDARDETIMRLGPNVARQLKRKIDIMQAHWRDYDRMFTVPNP
ncbi:hypothetical protein [Sphingomonas sp.]|jgi:hypothetical protein|uniref:hypothetical protein n=1 Tax=Sphingomonas sp. TaxID=28214 RepID=UPI002ED909B8